MSQCDLCGMDNGNYDFSRDCCLVRFILHVPTKTLRAGYLTWWMRKYGEERTERVKALVAKAWDDKIAAAKQQVLGRSK